MALLPMERPCPKVAPPNTPLSRQLSQGTTLAIALPLSLLPPVLIMASGKLVYGVNIFEMGFRAIDAGRLVIVILALLGSRLLVRQLVRLMAESPDTTWRQRLSAQTAIELRAYRYSLVLPAIITGVIPLLGGYATGSAPLLAWSALMLAIAAPDGLMLWMLRKVPATCQVRRHPAAFGFECVDTAVQP